MDARSIKDESTDQMVIKVRTPNQVNNSLHRTNTSDQPTRSTLQQALERQNINLNVMPPRRHSVHPGSAPSPSSNGTVTFNGNNKVIVKRLGSTTISTQRNSGGVQLPPNVTKLSPPTIRQMMSNGELVTRVNLSHHQSTSLAQMQNQHSRESQSRPDARDHIISKLQEQNRELKKALIDIRTESSEIVLGVNRWSSRITHMLNKFQSIQSPKSQAVPQSTLQQLASSSMPGPRTKVTARKSTSPMQPTYVNRSSMSPPPLQQMSRQVSISNLPQDQQSRIVKRYGAGYLMMSQQQHQQQVKAIQQQSTIRVLKTAATDSKTAPFRSPVFPIKDDKVLGLLECNLYQSQYFAHIKRSTFNLVSHFDISKPTQMLDSVLKTLIHEDLLNKFMLNDNIVNGVPAITWKNFPMVKDLFNAVVNMVSMRKFEKKVDPLSIDQFLKNKIIKHLQLAGRSVSATVTITRTQPPTSTRSANSPVTIRAVSPAEMPKSRTTLVKIRSDGSPVTKSNENSNDASESSKITNENDIIEAQHFAMEDADEGQAGDYEEFEEEMFTFEDED